MTATTAARFEPAPSMGEAYQRALQLTLQIAVNHHQAGQLAQAEQLYRAVLQCEPVQAQANHNLGLLLLQFEQPAAALPYLEAALAAKPESERYWLSYLEALAQDGQTALARERLAFACAHGLEGAVVEALAARLNIVPQEPAPAGAELQLGA